MEFHLENFDGPLDLLLHLIAKNKVSMYDIPIAEILDQYMEVLHAAESMDLDVAGAFVAMAAQLVFLPSIMLSGIMFPAEMLPGVLQTLGRLFPGTWGFLLLQNGGLRLQNLWYLLLVFCLSFAACAFLLKRRASE